MWSDVRGGGWDRETERGSANRTGFTMWKEILWIFVVKADLCVWRGGGGGGLSLLLIIVVDWNQIQPNKFKWNEHYDCLICAELQVQISQRRRRTFVLYILCFYRYDKRKQWDDKYLLNIWSICSLAGKIS